jgi:diguanylate cyclase (GGDEF)-like protein/PAS domain S-box-containing protein
MGVIPSPGQIAAGRKDGAVGKTLRPNHKGTLEDPDVLLDMAERIAVGIYITNAEGDILDANPAMLRLLGYSSLDSLRRAKATSIVDPALRAEEQRQLHKHGSVRDFELVIRRPDGELRWVMDTAYAVKDEATGTITYRGFMRDITIRKRLESQLLEQSVRDPLTGCFNRRHLHEFERKHGDKGWGALIFDIDHFKHYNDTYGHQAGDDILVRLTKFLGRHVRAEASLVRMGGDEFLVLLPGAAEEQTLRTAERIQLAAVKESPVPFSMGTAVRAHHESLEATIHRADQEMYAVRTFARSPNQERRQSH